MNIITKPSQSMKIKKETIFYAITKAVPLQVKKNLCLLRVI